MKWQGIVGQYESAEEFAARFYTEGHYLIDSPQQLKLEKAISEGTYAEAAAVTNCGMAAIGSVLEALVTRRKGILFSNSLFPGTQRLAESYQQKGFYVRFTDPTRLDEVKEHLRSYPFSLYFFEIIGNSMEMPVVDWYETMEVLAGTGAKAVVDTTFVPVFHPFLQKNGKVEVIEVASMSKWETVSDAVAGGRISGSAERIAQIKNSSHYRQVCMQPEIAERISLERLEKVFPLFSVLTLDAARVLEESPGVAKVYYPRLASHPQNSLTEKQFNSSGGGVLYLVLKGGEEAATKLTNLLSHRPFWSIAPSFGAEEWRIFPYIGELQKYAPVSGLVRIAAGETVGAVKALEKALGRL